MTIADWASRWRTRYGTDADLPAEPADSPTIELQLRHRSVRRFLDETISPDIVRTLAAAAQSGSSSSNLQLVSIIAVTDPGVRARISDALGGDPIVDRAPLLFVFVADLARASELATTSGGTLETADYLENTLVPFIDAGIAGQNLLLAAESLGLGGVFLGAIRNNPLAVAEVLHLPHRAFPIVGMAIGRPDPDERADIRPRLPQSAVLHWNHYDSEAWRQGAAVHEEAARGYFARFGRPEYSWRATLMARLGTLAGLHGRHRLRKQLAARGLARR